MSAWRPLEGLRVLDLTRNVAGPFATTILADMGAAVTKIEHPDGGDDTRQWGPPFVRGEGAMFLQLNRNKESICLDLANPEMLAVMDSLARESDIIVESFRPGTLDKLGFGHEWAMALNPRVIYASISAYGDVGPRKDMPGYDPLMQAYSGLMSITGENNAEPVRVGFSVIDMGTGMWCALGILAALERMRTTGRGERITTSLYETSIAWSMMVLGAHWASGEVPQAYGSGTSTIVPYRAYKARDAHILIAAGNDRLFAKLAQVLGHPEWVTADGFATNGQRVENRDKVDAAVAAIVSQRKAPELLEALIRAGIPCSEIRSLDALTDDAQARALGMFGQASSGAFTDQSLVAIPIKGGGERGAIDISAPKLGEHNSKVLQRLGYDAAAIERLLPAMQPPVNAGAAGTSS